MHKKDHNGFCVQIFHAFQFIYEEVYLTKYDLPPLKVVGYEGRTCLLSRGSDMKVG